MYVLSNVNTELWRKLLRLCLSFILNLMQVWRFGKIEGGLVEQTVGVSISPALTILAWYIACNVSKCILSNNTFQDIGFCQI